MTPSPQSRRGSRLSPRSGSRVHGLKALLKKFVAADKDGSGEVDASELLQMLPQGTDFDAARTLVKRFDTDRSGALSRGEFIKLQKHLWSREDTLH